MGKYLIYGFLAGLVLAGVTCGFFIDTTVPLGTNLGYAAAISFMLSALIGIVSLFAPVSTGMQIEDIRKRVVFITLAAFPGSLLVMLILCI